MPIAVLDHQEIATQVAGGDRPIIEDTEGLHWRIFAARCGDGSADCMAGLPVHADGTPRGDSLALFGDGFPDWQSAPRIPATLDELLEIVCEFFDPAEPSVMRQVIQRVLFSFFDYDLLPGHEVMDRVRGLISDEPAVSRAILDEHDWQRLRWYAADNPHPRSHEFRLCLTWTVRIMVHLEARALINA